MHVPHLHWIVADDTDTCNSYLENLLNRFGKLTFSLSTAKWPLLLINFVYNCNSVFEYSYQFIQVDTEKSNASHLATWKITCQ